MQNCPPDGAICISSKFVHQMAPLALVANLATRYRHLHFTLFPKLANQQVASLALLHCLGLPCWHYQFVLALVQIWSSASATCIASKVGHQIALLVLIHCLGLPYWHYQLVLSWYPHQPESHQLSLHKGLLLTH